MRGAESVAGELMHPAKVCNKGKEELTARTLPALLSWLCLDLSRSVWREGIRSAADARTHDLPKFSLETFRKLLRSQSRRGAGRMVSHPDLSVLRVVEILDG
jgi:hypothetical protein